MYNVCPLSCISCMLKYVYVLMGHLAYCMNNLLTYLLKNHKPENQKVLYLCAGSIFYFFLFLKTFAIVFTLIIRTNTTEHTGHPDEMTQN